MKTFKIKDKKALLELNEDVITIKKITSKNTSDLNSLILMLHKNFPDNRQETKPVPTYDPNLPYTQNPELNIDFETVDCSVSVLEVANPKDTTFEIHYETFADKIQKNSGC